LGKPSQFPTKHWLFVLIREEIVNAVRRGVGN